ncbi:alanine--tRNA ligase [Parvibaculum lavamentivorans]|uniref:Alanine--tRNA ligase n=1 Tax=Parvibaculum lavamentivorans (strain DS-1 / DSM 13023 / NCIMB 13966) TaxID=402881 RepID=SYA_PARL1|nr:alanine--tRNA ligase [Parvibaculum lavamentivorans]A7HWA5.2 RecName: Full=Alanine--tRNA ligase; AltName: Full=Alanyl-tRNA synthetase; Short=AlaRS [Parvibaculum lavamentivorans DS-1]
MAGVNEIRSKYLEFFRAQGHEVVASGPLVPNNDPTLLFTNAGMVPFKNVFTGQETRPYKRAASSQKCVRAGGKHNDLDNVGYTARHHTFFEMLGNFSFGDYYKAEAIEFAWDLITKELALPESRLMVTIYEDDDEAHGLWKKITGLSDDKIVRLGAKSNFWQMGDTGPCGPNSEIFYDHGDKIPGGPPGSPDEDGDRFIEIWNLVFMQYEQHEDGSRTRLPKPSIDTGMGLERIAAVLQGTHDNYSTDLMRSLIVASAEASKSDPDGPHAVSHRVIADHLRSSSFLLADGVMPSNEGRGYVLRRIMRRAMRHAQLVGVAEPLMWRLVPALVRQMGDAYPELRRAEALVTETLRLEETRFRETLTRGLKLLDEEIESLGGKGVLAGEVAFKLYDTYGFPLDLTQDALRSRGMSVDQTGFDEAMAKQRQDARAAWSGSGEKATEAVWFELRDKVGATEFLGYESEIAEGKVVALLVDGQPVDKVEAGTDAALITNQTPFYAESGGQVGDTGIVFSADGAEFPVIDTMKKLGALHVHIGKLARGTLKLGDIVEMKVDKSLRDATRANHSATHLLHEALRRVLGDHVTQKGSMVGPERLRFDFSHPKPMTPEEISEVETIVNRVIRQNAEVTTRLMTPEDAIAAGALALFGEKYGEEVRVLAMGLDDENPNGTYSVELCGGTHVRRVGDIAIFKIVSESAVASGIRRIEALTGEGARAYLVAQDRIAKEAASALRISTEDLPARVVSLMEERKRLERELAQAKKQLAMSGGGGSGGQESPVQEFGGVKLIARKLEGVNPKDLRGLIDESKKQLGSGVVVLVAISEDGKGAIAVGVTDDLTSRYNAVELVKAGAAAMGGKGGGGRPDMAQAGGPEAEKADAALDAVKAAVGELAGAA